MNSLEKAPFPADSRQIRCAESSPWVINFFVLFLKKHENYISALLRRSICSAHCHISGGN
jgi:hypothetical protein